MKKYLFLLAFVLVFPVSDFAQSQLEPVVTYEGGDLYFVPSKLTSKGISFLYTYKCNYESGKSWFTVFDDKLNVVKQAEIKPQILNYTTRTVISKRRFVRSSSAATRAVSEDGSYFLDDWTVTSDITEEKSVSNYDIVGPEVYDDNNSYHSRNMYLSQCLFDTDDDFEFLRIHYDLMPLTYCAADDPNGSIVTIGYEFGGEKCDECSEYYDDDLCAYVIIMTRYKVYGGVKDTGMDVVSLDGTVKKTIPGIVGMGSMVAVNGNYYVSAYNRTSNNYGLYKIASTTTSLPKVADITSKIGDDVTYSLDGFRVRPDTKGLVIRNGRKYLNK